MSEKSNGAQEVPSEPALGDSAIDNEVDEFQVVETLMPVATPKPSSTPHHVKGDGSGREVETGTKVEVKGLPMSWRYANIQRFFSMSSYRPHKFKHIHQSGIVYATFKRPEEAHKFIDAMHNQTTRRFKLSARIAEAAPDPYVRESRKEFSKGGRDGDPDTEPRSGIDLAIDVRKAVEKLGVTLPTYSDQLTSKHLEIKGVVQRFFHALLRAADTRADKLLLDYTLNDEGAEKHKREVISNDPLPVNEFAIGGGRPFAVAKELDDDAASLASESATSLVGLKRSASEVKSEKEENNEPAAKAAKTVEEGTTESQSEKEKPECVVSPKPIKFEPEVKAPNRVFTLEEIVPSPVTEKYRNKLEFTIGMGRLVGETQESCPKPHPVAGWRFASYKAGSCTVGPPDKCTILPDNVRKFVEIFQGYLAAHPRPVPEPTEASEPALDPSVDYSRRTDPDLSKHAESWTAFDPRTHGGHWRTLTVRTNANDDILAVLQVHPQHLPKIELVQERQYLADYMREHLDEKDDGLVGLWWQESSDVNSGGGVDPSRPMKLALRGSRASSTSECDTLTESLLSCSFRITLDAFFQTNTPAAEMLYSKIAEYVAPILEEYKSTKKNEPKTEEAVKSTTDAEMNGNTTNGDSDKREKVVDDSPLVLDLCCGTGTIGIFLAKTLGCRVLGIELSKLSVKDAIHNATANGLKLIDSQNTDALDVVDEECPEKGKIMFRQGKVEDCLREIGQRCYHATSRNVPVIAILDPPRGGVHSSVIACLRRCSAVTHIVYVACNPRAVLDNWLGMCRSSSKKYPGDPFRPIRGAAVDMFPQTPHCEFVSLFSRPLPSSTSK